MTEYDVYPCSSVDIIFLFVRRYWPGIFPSATLRERLLERFMVVSFTGSCLIKLEL